MKSADKAVCGCVRRGMTAGGDNRVMEVTLQSFRRRRFGDGELGLRCFANFVWGRGKF